MKTNEDIMSSSIWFNPNISKHNLFFPDWCQNGIYVIADIIDEEGNVCSLDKLRQRYGFHINFLNYITVRKSVKKFIGDNKIDNNFQLIRPYIPFHMKALLTSNKISKSLYTKFDQINTSRVKIETKWSLELNLECTTAMWKLIYKSCFQSVNDNTYKWFQYRIIHRIIGTKKYLKKIKRSDCDQCRLCGECEETSLHLFSECYKVQNLW